MGTTLTTLMTGLLVLGLLACTPAVANEHAGATPRTLVAGTLIRATTQALLSSRRNRAGETLTALVSGNVEDASGQVVIPAGSRVALQIAQIDGTIELDVTSLTVGDQEYPVRSRVEPPQLLKVRDIGTVVRAVPGRIIRTNAAGGGVVHGAAMPLASVDVVMARGTAILFVLPQPLTVR